MPSEKRSARTREDDVDGHKHKKHKHAKDKESDKDRVGRNRRKREKEALSVVDDDDEGVWVEKNIDEDGQIVRFSIYLCRALLMLPQSLAADIPSAADMNLKSHITSPPPAPLPHSTASSSSQREAWMLPPPSYQSTKPVVPSPLSAHPVEAELETTDASGMTEGYEEEGGSGRTVDGGVDFFSGLGTERKKKPTVPEPPKYSQRELNPDVNPNAAPLAKDVTTKPAPGGPGSNWRMMKLRRTYEEAQDSGKDIEEVALERYGNLEAWEDAKEERRILDERDERRQSRGGGDRDRDRRRGGRDDRDDGERRERYTYTDISSSGSRPASRASFRRPGDSAPSTPGGGTAQSSAFNTPASRPSPRPTFVPRTSVPSVSTPPIRPPPATASGSGPVPTSEDLNKLQAKVLRAKLMNAPNADALQKEYDAAVQRHDEGAAPGGTRTEVLPVFDAQGRLYDIGSAPVLPAGNERKPKPLDVYDRQGNVLRVNDDDDTLSIGDMLRQEKAAQRSTDGADMDSELARKIATDGKYEDDLDYVDDNAEKLARKRMRSEAMKRAFAINDYARTKKALDTCPFCHGEDDSQPKAGVVAMGTRAYLAVPTVEELVEGHCYIVPVQHHLSMLEAEDEVWDEVKNFMKTLMQMYNEQGKAPLFWETVVSLKQQRHTFIEVIPLPIPNWQDAPAYFREGILASESDWTQHNPLIDFTKRPGGFRRMMVESLPYFMVQWDYKGEKGYGHVIEGDAGGAADEENDYAGEEEGRKGTFPKNFAAEIVGNMLDIEPRRWMHPRRVDYSMNAQRAKSFGKLYAKWDWTPQLRAG
ncbi:hypothetical protein CALVIDRAFT_301645 [Calocera viscosa TUFC12733]|uniref:CwfJ C-terminus 1-domain-containing protein-like protein n=1 Tax=Calocera viscosa (strain TUFC12733) TaxID=1330018 RepID=A0A167IJM3_CALVF|nr:hypothetical protein CALVIDRAFT_301645 [Calocera viscosa TUFC12733]